MKPIAMTLLAGAMLAASLPAAAQYSPAYGGPAVRHDDNASWSGDVRGYDDFGRLYARIQRRIDHGLRDGSYTRRQADLYRIQARNIRVRADIQQRRGTFDPRETSLLLNRLLDRMQVARVRGREQNEQYGYRGDDRRYDPRFQDRNGDGRPDGYRDYNGDGRPDGYPR